MADLAGKETKVAYNGYASCPLVTAPGKCILAEFDYNLTPQETFPVNQGKEMYAMYILKKHFFPFLYWNLMLKLVFLSKLLINIYINYYISINYMFIFIKFQRKLEWSRAFQENI